MQHGPARVVRDAPKKSGSDAAPRALCVVVATRPALFRELLSNALRAEKLEVVGHGENEDELAALLPGRRANVLLFDYEALGPGGESPIRRLRRAFPETRILVLATRSGPETVEAVLCAGASGLVGKEEPFAVLVRGIRAVAAGEIWANRRATANAFERLSGGEAPQARGDLTAREQEIVQDVLLGRRNKEIARRLAISEKTVKTHLTNIFRKVGVDNRTALALFGRDHPGLKS